MSEPTITVPATRLDNPRSIPPVGLWLSTISAVHVESDDEQVLFVIVTFSFNVGDANYTLERAYPWDEAGQLEFGNLLHDAGLEGEVKPSDLMTRNVMVSVRTRGGGVSAFVKETEPVQQDETD